MIRELADHPLVTDEYVDAKDVPEELALPDGHVPAAADGQPDPLAQIHNLLPGGRWVLGKAPIVHSPTELDTVLLPTLRSGPPTLVILSGNAGDGKTAFIESVLEEAGDFRKPVPNEIDVTIGGSPYRVVLDGSEDTNDRSNDQLLEGALGFFSGERQVSPGRGTLIAVNKGRLLSYLEEHRAQYRYLWELAHERFVEGVHGDDSGYLLIDLNDRTVVGPSLDESMFGHVLRKLVQWEGWAECARCDAVEQCPVMLNVGALRHRRVQERLWKLFALIDLDDRLHVTARHVVTRLASVIGGGQRCPDIRRAVNRGAEFPHRAYFYGAAFLGRADESSVEEALFNEIASAYDPAETASPTRDRRLGLAISSGVLLDAMTTAAELPASDLAALEREASVLAARTVESSGAGDVAEYRQAHLNLMAKVLRRQYFMSDRSAEVVPVQAFQAYMSVTMDGEDKLVRRIVRSLNATLGIGRTGPLGLIVPRDYSRGLAGSGFALTIPEEAFTVAPGTGLGTAFHMSTFIRSWPRSILFTAEDGGIPIATLSIPLLMLEILDRADRGFRPTSRTERSYLVRVSTFYRRLAEHRWGSSYDYVLYERGRVRASVAVSASSLDFWVP